MRGFDAKRDNVAPLTEGFPRITRTEWKAGKRHLPLTESQAKAARAYVVERMKPHFDEPAEFTCDTCAARFECVYAFDYYNTNGDCLAEK